MTCIAVDDEPKALDILTLFIARIPFLHLQGTFRDPFKAMEFITKSKPDLLFLDISMPELTGIQLLKSLSFTPLVILTTAYSEHAITGYELNAIDYLLKPIEFDRFLKAVMKAKEIFTLKSENELRKTKSVRQNEDVIYIKSGTKTYRIKTNAILYIEGMGNYVTLFLADKKITTYVSIQNVLKLLPPNLFCRIHKSYIISLKYIDVIEKHQVIIKNKPIPIGMTYREQFSKIIEKK